MKLTLAAAVALLLVALPARANTIRTSSNYGVLGGAAASGVTGSVSDPSAQVVVCVTEDDTNVATATNCGSETTDPTTNLGYDLLVSIQSTDSALTLDLGSDAVSSPLTSGLTNSSDQSSASYGVWECNSFLSGTDPNWNTSSDGSGVQFCSDPSSAATAACIAALGTGSSGDSSISIPTACLVPGIVLYFDESAVDSALVTLTPSTTATPEPSSLVLLALGLAGLAALGRRRLPLLSH